jgi:hypothetical protein
MPFTPTSLRAPRDESALWKPVRTENPDILTNVGGIPTAFVNKDHKNANLDLHAQPVQTSFALFIYSSLSVTFTPVEPWNTTTFLSL